MACVGYSWWYLFYASVEVLKFRFYLNYEGVLISHAYYANCVLTANVLPILQWILRKVSTKDTCQSVGLSDTSDNLHVFTQKEVLEWSYPYLSVECLTRLLELKWKLQIKILFPDMIWILDIDFIMQILV